MATTDTLIETVHEWESRRGAHVYVLQHADERCPRAIEAEGIGARSAAAEPELVRWPCPECIEVSAPTAKDPNGGRYDSIDAPTGGGGARSTTTGGPSLAATPKQVRFLTALVRGSVSRTDEWVDGTLTADDAEGIVYLVAAACESKQQASDAIDRLQAAGCSPVWDALVRTAPAADVEQPAGAAPARTNRHAATCASCGSDVPAETGSLTKSPSGRWEVRHHPVCPTAAVPTSTLDLTGLPAGRYAVPGGDTRLKVQVDRPTEGRWAGYVFVRDAAEYGSGQRYGRQQPGSLYSGDIVEQLTAILADPAAASMAYGRLVGRCGVCSRHLEDERSVERGIGPVCATKMGW